MKTNVFPTVRFSLLSLLIAGGLLLFSSCNQKEEETPDPITDEEVVEVISSAFVYGAEGLTDEIEDAAEVAARYSEKSGNNDYCGVSFDSTVAANLTNPNLSVDFSTSWNWMVNCNNASIPTSLDFARTASGSFETNRIFVESESNGSWSIDNLIGGNNWVFSGEFNRTSTSRSKVGNQRELNSVLNLTFPSVEVRKIDPEIVSGSGTATTTISGSGGNSITVEGGITFLGNGKATLVINGKSYEIDLN